jgi:hypothetical protein
METGRRLEICSPPQGLAPCQDDPLAGLAIAPERAGTDDQSLDPISQTEIPRLKDQREQ